MVMLGKFRAGSEGYGRLHKVTSRPVRRLDTHRLTHVPQSKGVAGSGLQVVSPPLVETLSHDSGSVNVLLIRVGFLWQPPEEGRKGSKVWVI